MHTADQHRQRVHLALRSLQDPRARVELRDADPKAPDTGWQRRALGFVVSAMVVASGVALMERGQAKGGVEGEVTRGRVAHGAVTHLQFGRAPVRSDVYEGLKTKDVSINGVSLKMVLPVDQIRLSKQAAQQQGLHAAGLDWKDVFAVIHAESGWVARDGYGRNGKISRGLGQFEDDTARSLGIDSEDPMEAATGVAKLLKEGAQWSRRQGFNLRKGALSVHYNLSTRARNAWDGRSQDKLPLATRRHIQAVEHGRSLAAKLERDMHAQQLALSRKLRILGAHVENIRTSQSHGVFKQTASAASADSAALGVAGGSGKVAGAGATGAAGGRRIADRTNQNQVMKGLVATQLQGTITSTSQDTQLQRTLALRKDAAREAARSDAMRIAGLNAFDLRSHHDPAWLRSQAVMLAQRVKANYAQTQVLQRQWQGTPELDASVAHRVHRQNQVGSA